MREFKPLLVGASFAALLLGSTAFAADPGAAFTPSAPKIVLQSEGGQAGTPRETGTGQSTMGKPAVTTGQTGTPAQPGESSQSGMTGKTMGSETGATAFRGMRVSDLTGKEVVNAQGRELGTIDRIVKSNQDNNIYAVVSPRGAGSEEYVVPLDELQPRGDNVSAGSMTQDELRAMNRYNPSNYEQVAGDQQIGGGSSQTR